MQPTVPLPCPPCRARRTLSATPSAPWTLPINAMHICTRLSGALCPHSLMGHPTPTVATRHLHMPTHQVRCRRPRTTHHSRERIRFHRDCTSSGPCPPTSLPLHRKHKCSRRSPFRRVIHGSTITTSVPRRRLHFRSRRIATSAPRATKPSAGRRV